MLSEPADAVSAGKYAMSDRGHVLSDLSDEMPGWPNLLSAAAYAVPASRYTMSIVCDAVPAGKYAMSACMYAVSVFEYIVSDEADTVSGWNRYVVSMAEYEVSGACDGVWGGYKVSASAYAVSRDDNDVLCFDEMSCVTHALPAYKYLLSAYKHAV